jgi:hypothetical protein
MKRAVLFLIMGPALATVVASRLLLVAPGALDGERFKVSLRPLHMSIACSRGIPLVDRSAGNDLPDSFAGRWWPA